MAWFLTAIWLNAYTHRRVFQSTGPLPSKEACWALDRDLVAHQVWTGRWRLVMTICEKERSIKP